MEYKILHRITTAITILNVITAIPAKAFLRAILRAILKAMPAYLLTPKETHFAEVANSYSLTFNVCYNILINNRLTNNRFEQ